jgi:hypothetical protein
MGCLIWFVVYRSLKKKVGEYKKLTGELPGIWRIAAQSKVRSSHNMNTEVEQ